MKTLRQKHDKLEGQCYDRFSELLETGDFNFYEDRDEDDEEDLDNCISVGFTSGANGDEKFYKLLSITEDGLYAAEDDDYSNKLFWRFSDLSCPYWMIEVIEAMEEYIERKEAEGN